MFLCNCRRQANVHIVEFHGHGPCSLCVNPRPQLTEAEGVALPALRGLGLGFGLTFRVPVPQKDDAKRH